MEIRGEAERGPVPVQAGQPPSLLWALSLAVSSREELPEPPASLVCGQPPLSPGPGKRGRAAREALLSCAPVWLLPSRPHLGASGRGSHDLPGDRRCME